jgi:hypothetical protein
VKWWKPVKWEFQDGPLSVLEKNLWCIRLVEEAGNMEEGRLSATVSLVSLALV